MDDLDRSAARDFTWRYALALGVVAALTIAAQVAVQVALHRSQTDAEVINLAGRQRMLSQRLTMAALAAERVPAHAATVTAVLGEWGAAHERLSAGEDLANAGRRNSHAVRTAFSSIAEPFAAMQRAAQPPIDTAALLHAQEAFLAGMERVVALYRAEAETRVQRLITLELSLCVLLLVVLVAEAFLVFRPAVARLRAAIHERERLREQEFENRELQVAAETARSIGQDLHDGLGQTLTALSFQAKALERTAGQSAQALTAGIGEAIAQCRAQARRLAPLEIQAAGLEAAVRELCHATGVATGITCRLVWQDPGPPPATHGEIFRIIQESLTNAVRHSQARTVEVLIGPRTLTVRDDGQNPKPIEAGVGMRSMRARSNRLGGDLTCGPLPGGGWAVRLVLP
jgi:signal transduction histidine kinase